MDLVKLWRNTPVTAIKGNDVDISRDVIISSARQGLTKAIAILGLKRSDYVGMPDYVGHCIIDFIGRKATPVPIKFLPQKYASAVLLYDQWGWQKTSIARLELKKKYQNIRIIWDRVDSLPLSFGDEAVNSENEADIQIFSLSKTLGAGGGGLVWIAGKGWLQQGTCLDASLIDGLSNILNDANLNKQFYSKIDGFIRNECICNTPNLDKWLRNNNINTATKKENSLRRDRIKIFDSTIMKSLPNWMQNQIRNDMLPAPGIFPIAVNGDIDIIAKDIYAKFRVGIPSVYHFNFNDSYLNPGWRKVLAIPLHSEIETSLLVNIVRYMHDNSIFVNNCTR